MYLWGNFFQNFQAAILLETKVYSPALKNTVTSVMPEVTCSCLSLVGQSASFPLYIYEIPIIRGHILFFNNGGRGKNVTSRCKNTLLTLRSGSSHSVTKVWYRALLWKENTLCSDIPPLVGVGVGEEVRGWNLLK